MTSLDPRAFAAFAWHDLITSKTLKALVVIELAAVGGFVEGVADGGIPLTRKSIAAFCASQAAVVMAFLIRQTLSEIAARTSGLVSPELAQAVTKEVETRAVAIVAEKHPEAATLLKTELSKTDPPLGTGPVAVPVTDPLQVSVKP